MSNYPKYYIKNYYSDISYFSTSNFNHSNEINQSKTNVIYSKIPPITIKEQKFSNNNSNFNSFNNLISHSYLFITLGNNFLLFECCLDFYNWFRLFLHCWIRKWHPFLFIRSGFFCEVDFFEKIRFFYKINYIFVALSADFCQHISS